MTIEHPLEELGECGAAAIAELRMALRERKGSTFPLGTLLALERRLLPIVRTSISVRKDWREPPPRADCRTAYLYGTTTEDTVIDLAEPGMPVRAQDDRTLARVIDGAPAPIHPLKPDRALDQALYTKGLRCTAVFPLMDPDGGRFGTLNAGTAEESGIDESHRTLLTSLAREIEGPLWQALQATLPSE